MVRCFCHVDSANLSEGGVRYKTVCRPQIEIRDNCCDHQRVSLVSLLNTGLLQQHSYDILPKETELFNFCIGDNPSLVGSHFEKENLKGSCDHLIPLWGEECRLKSQQNSDIV